MTTVVKKSVTVNQDDAVATQAAPKNESERIWLEIKSIPLEIFALPNQTVEDHATRFATPGKQLLLRLKSSAVLPALEEALDSDKYKVELSNPYVIVTRVTE